MALTGHDIWRPRAAGAAQAAARESGRARLSRSALGLALAMGLAAACSDGEATADEACGLDAAEVSAVLGVPVGEPFVSMGNPESLARAQSTCSYSGENHSVSFTSIPEEADDADRDFLLDFGSRDDGEAVPTWGADGRSWTDGGNDRSGNVDAKDRSWLISVNQTPPLESGVDVSVEEQADTNRAALESIIGRMLAGS